MTAQRSEFPTTAMPLAEDRSSDCGREVTTALICDTPLLRRGLQRVLSETPFALVEESPATDPKLVSGKAQEPALVILAVSQPSNRTPEMVRQAKEQHPAARIVLLADHIDLTLVTQGRKAGVDGFCLTGSSREVLITSLEMVMLGETMLPGPVVRSIIDSMAPGPEPELATEVPQEPKASAPGARSLSAREAEVLSSLMEGTPNKLIARKLHLTEATVKVHIKAILRKIGATNRTQAAMWAKGHQHG
jgi:two-component system, NarL family, nitrate/nitrite response regulator NarL